MQTMPATLSLILVRRRMMGSCFAYLDDLGSVAPRQLRLRCPRMLRPTKRFKSQQLKCARKSKKGCVQSAGQCRQSNALDAAQIAGKIADRKNRQRALYRLRHQRLQTQPDQRPAQPRQIRAPLRRRRQRLCFRHRRMTRRPQLLT